MAPSLESLPKATFSSTTYSRALRLTLDMRSGPLTARETVVLLLPRKPPPATRKYISLWGSSSPRKAPTVGAMNRPAARRIMRNSHGRTEDMRGTGPAPALDASEGYGHNPQPRQRS